MKLNGPIGPIGPGMAETRSRMISAEVATRVPLNANYAHPHDYDNLPEVVQGMFSPKQFAWMDDESRKTLISDITNPEVPED